MTFIVTVQETPDGELFIELPPEIVTSLKLKVGDTMYWAVGDREATLSKSPTSLVKIETASTFKMTYLVEVPLGHTIESITELPEPTELNQEHSGEFIVSQEPISRKECDALLHAYCPGVGAGVRFNAFINRIVDTKDE